MTRTLVCLATLFLYGCPSTGPVPASPKPRRPEPKQVDEAPKAPTDCAVIDPKQLAPAVPYPERSISESANLANEGVDLLVQSRSRNLEPVEREEIFTEAVAKLLTALAADPYNVHATYNLAAAYVQKQEFDQALAEFQRAIDLEPDLAEAHFGMGVVYVLKSENDQAIAAFVRFQELDTGRDRVATEQAKEYLRQLRGE